MPLTNTTIKNSKPSKKAIKLFDIEHQLAHAVLDPNGRAHNRTAHLPERKRMMQKWVDYLNKLKAGAEIVQIHQHA